MNQPYDLDSGISEYFEFILKGNTYRFRYPTTRELEEFTGLDLRDEKSNNVAKDFLIKFVEKVNEKSPEFKDIIDDMSVKYWNRFNDMVKTELSSDGNQDSKNS